VAIVDKKPEVSRQALSWMACSSLKVLLLEPNTAGTWYVVLFRHFRPERPSCDPDRGQHAPLLPSVTLACYPSSISASSTIPSARHRSVTLGRTVLHTSKRCGTCNATVTLVLCARLLPLVRPLDFPRTPVLLQRCSGLVPNPDGTLGWPPGQ